MLLYYRNPQPWKYHAQLRSVFVICHLMSMHMRLSNGVYVRLCF